MAQSGCPWMSQCVRHSACAPAAATSVREHDIVLPTTSGGERIAEPASPPPWSNQPACPVAPWCWRDEVRADSWCRSPASWCCIPGLPSRARPLGASRLDDGLCPPSTPPWATNQWAGWALDDPHPQPRQGASTPCRGTQRVGVLAIDDVHRQLSSGGPTTMVVQPSAPPTCWIPKSRTRCSMMRRIAITARVSPFIASSHSATWSPSSPTSRSPTSTRRGSASTCAAPQRTRCRGSAPWPRAGRWVGRRGSRADVLRSRATLTGVPCHQACPWCRCCASCRSGGRFSDSDCRVPCGAHSDATRDGTSTAWPYRSPRTCSAPRSL